MRQAFWMLTLATTVAAAIPQVCLGAPADVVAQARKLIVDKDLKAAAHVLEDALGASQGEDRKAVVDLLKETYKSLIQESKAAGKEQEAASYSDDLAILEAHPSPAATAPPTLPAPAPSPAPEVVKTPPPPSGPAPKPVDPVAVPRAEQPFDPGLFPDPSQADAPKELPPLDAPLSQPTGVAPPKAVPAPQKTAPPPKSTAPPSKDAIVEEIPSLNAPKRTSAIPAPMPPASRPTPDASPNDLAAADALFNQKKYEQAGKLYAGLAAHNQLPAERKKVWAYCRWAAVVARINAPPRTSQEWDEIEREILSVQRLTPGNWYGEYLKDRVAAARKGERPTARAGGLVVRGATPEEPETDQAPQTPRRRRPTADDQARQAGGEQPLDLPSLISAPGDAQDQIPQPQAAAPAPTAPAQTLAQTAPAGLPNTSTVSWQIHETASFRIFHTDQALAEKAAEAAEAVRAVQGTRWGSQASHGAWSPRCDLYLYPTATDFARMTGQPETSPGFSTMGISGDQITTRRVNLRADHPLLLSAILPHEVTHVVLADIFSDQQIPRWADEGMAVLAEPVAEQVSRAAELSDPLAQKRVFKLSQLMTIDYPESQHWNLYYAQSVSLTQFLVRQGTAAQFVAFIKGTQQRGAEAALREVYKIEGFDDLENRWQAYARREAAQVASAEVAPADSSTTQR